MAEEKYIHPLYGDVLQDPIKAREVTQEELAQRAQQIEEISSKVQQIDMERIEQVETAIAFVWLAMGEFQGLIVVSSEDKKRMFKGGDACRAIVDRVRKRIDGEN